MRQLFFTLIKAKMCIIIIALLPLINEDLRNFLQTFTRFYTKKKASLNFRDES